MAQNDTIHLQNSYVDASRTLHINEAVWISAHAPDRTPLTPLPGGGGPGYGGWGLDAGRPRGTGGPPRFNHEKRWRTAFGDEHQAVSNGYAEQDAPTLQQLPTQIAADRAAIQQQANTAATSPPSLSNFNNS